MLHKNHSSSPLHVSPQPSLKIGKSEHTRTAILNAALDFIWSHPFRDLTVQSLMASTGVGRSAFYQYFKDLHEVMNTLLLMLQGEIFDAAKPWITGVGDPVVLMNEAIAGLVQIAYHGGPIYRAFLDAAATDDQSEKAWRHFLDGFDDAACARIEADQKQGLIPDINVRPVAMALNRLDAYTLIEAFGQHPRNEPEPVREALARIWVSILYGSEFIRSGSSNLVRT